MPTFEYIAKDPSGIERAGVMQADSEAAVVHTLGQRALFPVTISTRTTPAGRQGTGRRVRLRELSVAYGQLADLLRAGVPMLRALEILSRATVNVRLVQLMDQVREDVASGETLADSLGKHPQVFGDLHVAMVRAGEHAGFLEEVLTNLAGFLERQDDLRGKVRGAMIYPVILAVMGALAVTVILLFLVPQFQQFLADVPLPLPSQILFGLSDALHTHGLLIVGAVVLVALPIGGYVRSEAGQKLWAAW